MGLLSKGWKLIYPDHLRSSCHARDPLIGLDIGSHSIKVVQINSKNGRWHLQYLGVKSLPQPTSEEGSGNSDKAIEDAIRDLVQEGHLLQTNVTCSMRGPSVMIKSIQVPIMTVSELKEHLGWEMDQYIPSEVRDIYWDFHIPNRGHRETSELMMSVLLVAVKKESVHRRVELIQRSGLNPVVMDVDILALSNLFAFNYEDHDPHKILLIHVSPSGVCMSVMNEGNPIFIREMEVGGDGYRDLMELTVRNPRKENSFGDVAPGTDSLEFLLKEVYREISNEVKKIIEYCSDMDPPHQIGKLFLNGGYAGAPGLAKTIEAELNLPLEFLDPLKKLDVHSNLNGGEGIRSVDLLSGVGIGLALRGIEDG